jgi:hypothetical protein
MIGANDPYANYLETEGLAGIGSTKGVLDS